MFTHCTPGVPHPLCVRSRPERPSQPLGGRRAAAPRGAPHPRPGPYIRVGAQSTLGPRVKVQKSHALGALPHSALAQNPASVVGPQDWYIPLPPPGRTRGSEMLFSRSGSQPAGPRASPQVCTTSPPPATALPRRVTAPNRLCFLGSPGQGIWTLEPRALYLEVLSQKGFVSKIQFP